MKIAYNSIFYICILLIMSQTSLFGQSIHMPKSIVFEKNSKDQIVTKYMVRPKNTLYSICKAYKTTAGDIESLNQDKEVIFLNPGDTLDIFFHSDIIDLISKDSNIAEYIPVYYKTSPKDNLYRISRVYFNQNMQALMQRNELNNFDLKPGQMILIGWKQIQEGEIYNSTIAQENTDIDSDQIDMDNIQDDDQAEVVNDTEIESDIQVEIPDTLNQLEVDVAIEYGHQNGLAIWNKNSKASGMFALHSEAKSGTLIEVLNPQLNRTISVKVIGKIPGNSYPENVKLILSPDAAKSLGALDTRFYVKTTYIKE
jgi:LysM repeat protein